MRTYLRTAVFVVALTVIGGVLVVGAASGAQHDTILVSRVSGESGAGGDSGSTVYGMSDDGRYVVFVSTANNLSTEDNDAFSSVFVRDTVDATTTLVSRATGASGASGELGAAGAAISADGRYVAFVSYSDNLSSEDDDSRSDIFVRDLVAQTTTLASRATGSGGVGGDRDSQHPSISADGRYVAFVSHALNLSDADADETLDVFVRDLQLDTTTLVSRADGLLGGGGDANSSASSISADGSRIAFDSDANNLSSDDNDSFRNVFVRNTVDDTTVLVSRMDGASGVGGNGNSSAPSISADGTSVAFHSGAENLSADDVAFSDVFTRDLTDARTDLVSRREGVTGAGGDSNSSAAAASADGRYVAFASSAADLSTSDNDSVQDIFVRDVVGGTTLFVSRASGANGAAGNNTSYSPAISSTGRYVAFTSLASLGTDDASDSDAFRRDLLGAPVVTYPLNVAVTGSGGGAVTSAPAGIVCGVDCSESYAEGTQVVLTATADAGSTFTGWTGDCSGSAGCTLTMDATKDATATFDISDVTAPETTIDSHPPRRTRKRGATFAFSSPDPSATFECRIDVAPYATCVSSQQYLSLKRTKHTFDVRAIDHAGNVDPTPATFTWRIR